jgi:hypothetical protein
MTMADALIGQLYFSILIATLVGMALQARPSGGQQAVPPKKVTPI